MPQNFQNKLIDNHGRVIDYLRLAITDRCNLRCRYCRTEDGVPFIPHAEILTFEELEYLVTIFCRLGVNKIRVTGGEPFSRRGCISFMGRLRRMEGVEFLHITTNGVKTARFLEELERIGIDGMNLSLDTLDPERFAYLTRRDYLDSVLETFHGSLKRGIPLKVNSVVLESTTDEDIKGMAELARKYPITLRFIESMAFSGGNELKNGRKGELRKRLSGIFELHDVTPDIPTTARIYEVAGFKGTIGIIEGHSREFCSRCNKLRITPVGTLKTCLYDNGVLDLKALVRSGINDDALMQKISAAVCNRYVNGEVAEGNCRPVDEPSMASIGG